jgi:Putative collagen-binding domain of a collagenase
VDTTLEDFRPPYGGLLTYTRYARSFMEENLPFWEMAPQDGLLSGESGESTANGGGQVFAKPGQLYAVYLPDATSTGSLDLSGVSGEFQKRWYNPRTGAFAGTPQSMSGGGKRSLGAPPSSASADWVVLVQASG